MQLSSFFIFQKNQKGFITLPTILIIVAVILLGAGGYGGYRYNLLSKELVSTQEKLNQNQKKLSDVTVDFESQVSTLKNNLLQAEGDNENLLNKLSAEQTKNTTFENEIRGISNSVSTLEKLNSIDQELLQKYSKVYFLNEHYVPASLVTIDSAYVSATEKLLQIHTRVWPYLQQMLNAMGQNNLKISITSAYRSFGTQSSLKSTYKILYGSGANTFSADQGYSEHQLGTTVDFSTQVLKGDLSVKFETSPEYIWLTNNAYRYGFILSYPKKNTYYQFEPWHWRFVGVRLATKLHDTNVSFYDMPQRDINEYRINLFD